MQKTGNFLFGDVLSIQDIFLHKGHSYIKSGQQSFYDYCLENKDRLWKAIELWDYEKNDGVSPKDVYCRTHYKAWFKCDRGIHKSWNQHIHQISKYQKFPKCKYCRSFYQYCIDNGHEDWLKRWDYEKNKKHPIDVPFRSSNKQYFFKCPLGIHESEPKNLSNFVKQPGSRLCKACGSLFFWGISNIPQFEKNFWSSKNTESNKIAGVGSGELLWFKCENGHPDYQMPAQCFHRGQRCPYCSSKRIYKNDSLGEKYPESFGVWSDENSRTPYDYSTSSNKYVFWKCENDQHPDYKRQINHAVRYEFRCPVCSKDNTQSTIQKKVYKYLTENLKLKVLNESKCSIVPVNPKTKYKLPFDNEVCGLNLIIEVNGPQHYTKKSYVKFYAKKGKSAEELLHQRRLYDRYKRIFAKLKGYNYLELSHIDINNGNYKNIILSEIKKIDPLFDENKSTEACI